MKQDEIIEMVLKTRAGKINDVIIIEVSELILFSKMVAAKEREACAKVCEGHDLWGPLAAKTIRARGEA